MASADDEFLPFAAASRASCRFTPPGCARDADGRGWQDGERELRIRPEAMGGVELPGG